MSLVVSLDKLRVPVTFVSQQFEFLIERIKETS